MNKIHDVEIHTSTGLYPGWEKVSCHTCTVAIIHRPWESSFNWNRRKSEFLAEHQKTEQENERS